MEVVDGTGTSLPPCVGPQAYDSSGPATTFYGTTTLSFVIPSVAEGSAVQRTFPGNDEFLSSNKIVISPAPACRETGAQRSGEICGFLALSSLGKLLINQLADSME
jgi:hypothetical protein